MKLINKWVWITIIILLLLSVGFLSVAFSSDSNSSMIIGLILGIIPLALAVGLFMIANNKIKTAIKTQQPVKSPFINNIAMIERISKEKAERWAKERNEYQYTFNGALKTGNYELFHYSPSEDKAQEWLYTLKVGDEIYVVNNYDHDNYDYTMGYDIPLPPQLAHLYNTKWVCRLYVYSINDENPDSRSIEILAAYNQ